MSDRNLIRRAWWAIHSRWMYRRSIMRPKVHICWWGATLGPWFGSYVVLNWHAFEGPSFYTSPNATPWHHDARSLFRRRLLSSHCSCDGCEALRCIEQPDAARGGLPNG